MKTIRRLGRDALDRIAPPPVLIGHSHSNSIFQAAATAGFRLKGFNFWVAPQPALNVERTAFHPEIARVLARGPVFSAVGGGAHNVLGLLRHPRPFDFVLPLRPDLPVDPDAEILPLMAVREALAADLGQFLEIIALVRAAATGKVFHIESPPPLHDGALILPDVPWTLFPNLTREISPPALRYKLWRLHSDMVAEFCAQQGIEVIPHPPESVDETGYLRPVHYTDATHTNESYGALVLQQIRRAL